MKFKYLVYTVIDFAGRPIETCLNDLGEAEWELVAILPPSYDGTSKFIFKKTTKNS